ncbi:MAG: efflux transporter periplasmic adaptor subunit [Verrucomicrobia bacterium]|nr:MAG: efflux transporter periplasmic adaptor subunit [Verrucomicrobiota bacterium]
MNQTKHRKHRHNGAEDRQSRARPKEPPDAEDRYATGEQNGHARTPQRGVPTHPPVRSVAVWGPIAAVTVLAFLVTIGVWRRVQERGQEKAFTKQATQLEVNVVSAQRDRKPKDLILPGTFQAFKETTIYPRANGYVKDWKVDIGDNVKEGQLLAEIETPEVDQQLAQAKANYDIAKVTADRWRDLVEKKVVSAQENDEKQKAAEAARANLEQLQKTQGFKEIVAPFGGSISARNIDVGTLVTAGTGNAGTPLFRIVQSDPLRVYVYVPQTNAPSMHEGLATKILVQEFPGQDFDGTVTRTAGALDPQSRTMQVEVQVPNHEGKLYAGMYGQVKFLLVDENAPIVVPANAFLFRTEGPQVAILVNENRIHWQNIHVGRDFGTNLEVLDGLTENTKVVINPTDDLHEGIQVQVKPTEKPKG